MSETKFVNCLSCGQVIEVYHGASSISQYCSKCFKIHDLKVEIQRLKTELQDWKARALEAEAKLKSLRELPSMQTLNNDRSWCRWVKRDAALAEIAEEDPKCE